MEIGVLMDSSYKTQYTKVEINVGDADPKNDYFGYLAVQLQVDGVGGFFADAMDLKLVKKLREGLKHVPNLMVESDVSLEDAAILINLPCTAAKEYAVDVVKIVKSVEQEFNSRME